MPQIIEVPGYGNVEFPDEMTDQQIAAAIQRTVQPQSPRDRWAAELERGRAVPEAADGNAPMSGVAGINRGIAALAGLPVDTLMNVADLAKAGYGTVVTAAGRPDLAPTIGDRGSVIGSAEHLSGLLERAGIMTVPRGDTAADRYAFAAGMAAPSGVLSPSQIPANLARATSSGLAAQAAMDVSENPATAASAALLAGAAPTGLRGGTRLALRGGDENLPQMRENIESFRQLGLEPTAGQASGLFRTQAAESLMSAAPGSAGVMADTAARQQGLLGAAVDRIASGISRAGSPMEAGRSISKGILGDAGFKASFQARQEKLYNELDAHIPAQAPVDVSNTMAALKALNADIPNAPRVSKFFKNAKIRGIEEAMRSDTGDGGVLPYEAIKKLRTLVGREISDSSLVSTVPRSKWKAVYAALSGDLESAASAAGPQAMQAYKRANDYTRAGIERLDMLDSVVGAGSPEAIYAAALSGTKTGNTVLSATIKSLPAQARKDVAATVVRRMGLATPGQQGADGDTFSTATFLTNWNRMSPEARGTLFANLDEATVSDLNALARVADNIKQGSRVYANPSGTAGRGANLLFGGALGSALLRGRPGEAIGLLAGAGGLNLTARAASNPKVVDFLARSTGLPRDYLLSELSALVAQGYEGDEQ